MARRVWEHQQSCQEMAQLLIPALRHVAKRCGYALGVHGSLSYDIDVIACPWREDNVKTAEELKDAFVKCIEGITGFAFVNPPEPAKKPHGRLAWSIHVGGGPYVDLSIMPVAANSEGRNSGKLER